MENTINDEKINRVLAWMQGEKLNYINGEWKRSTSDKVFHSTNPADRSTINNYTMASADDVDAAVQSAKTCHQQGSWSKMNRRQRAAILREIGQLIRSHTEELAIMETIANGKTYSESLYDDLPDCSDIFDYYAGWVDKHYGETCPVEDGFINYTIREPLGVCGLIVPWNFPLLLACWKIAPALAAGNTIVVKPSEYTPYSLIRVIELIDQHLDLPKGLINLVLGDGKVGDMISRHMLIDKVSFTGSTATGRHILRGAADSNFKQITLELGGKSPNILFDDTPELESAIERSFHLAFSHKGEKCSEPTRFFIHEKIMDKVVSGLVERANKVKCGNGFDPSVTQGPQCNIGQYEKIWRYIEIGQEEGAKLVVGGKNKTADNDKGGFFVPPTIFTEVDNKMRIAQEEIFGPVLSIIPFKTEQEVIEMANDTIYGLAAGLYTADASRAQRVALQLDAGQVFINRYGCYDFSSPFGGFKQSGWGKEMGRHSMDAYTRLKSIWQKLD